MNIPTYWRGGNTVKRYFTPTTWWIFGLSASTVVLALLALFLDKRHDRILDAWIEQIDVSTDLRAERDSLQEHLVACRQLNGALLHAIDSLDDWPRSEFMESVAVMEDLFGVPERVQVQDRLDDWCDPMPRLEKWGDTYVAIGTIGVPPDVDSFMVFLEGPTSSAMAATPLPDTLAPRDTSISIESLWPPAEFIPTADGKMGRAEWVDFCYRCARIFPEGTYHICAPRYPHLWPWSVRR